MEPLGAPTGQLHEDKHYLLLVAGHAGEFPPHPGEKLVGKAAGLGVRREALARELLGKTARVPRLLGKSNNVALQCGIGKTWNIGG